MEIPAGFVKWRGYWFRCPHCSYRAYSAIGLVGMAKESKAMVWRFWCPACAQLSQPSRPGLARFVILVASLMLFVGLLGPIYFVLTAMGAGISWTRASWWMIGGAGMAFLVVPLLTRLFNSYRPA